MTTPDVILTMHNDPEQKRRWSEISGAEVLTRSDLEADPDAIAGVTVVFGHLSDEQVEAAHRLRWMQVMGAGVERLLTDTVRARDFTITNASGIHAEPITEHMFAMVLAALRHLPEAWEHQRRRQWSRFAYEMGVGMLAGRTLGVLGVGAIGGHSARVGEAFGMQVLGLRRSGEPHPNVERMFTPDDRLGFFSECDVVMNSMPLTPATRGFMGRGEFAALPDGAIVCNAGRGPTIDSDALLEALESGRLGAACLDVTDHEPLPEDHPLWTAPNCYITPHYSGWQPAYMQRAADVFEDNLRRWLAGEPLRNVVDREHGY